MQKPNVVLSKGVHRQNEIIKIVFAKNDLILIKLKEMDCLRWSKTLASWYVPLSACPYTRLYTLLKDVAYIDYKQFLVSDITNPLNNDKTKLPEIVSIKKPVNCLGELNDEQKIKLNIFKKWLVSKRYAASTIETYTDALKTFLRYYNNTPIEELNNQSLIDFNNDYIIKNKFSASFQNQVVNAIKLFFSRVEDKKLQPELIHRPKRPKLLPNVLSKEEVKQILNALSNIKHKAMLGLIYSCGLRRSELLNLKLNNIDSKRHLLIIKQSKGRKDRIVPLSEKTIELLRTYFEAYKPKEWLFEGQDRSQRYDESSLAAVLKQAVEKCRISKPITLHWLRHSYATHLLENGTDLRYIQEILGHSRSTTTEIYTHVSNLSIQKVISPFDSL